MVSAITQFGFFLLFCLFVCPSREDDVRPTEITVASGQGFLIRIDSPALAFLQTCQLIRNDEQYQWSIDQNVSYTLVTGEFIVPFIPDGCGVRVHNSNEQSTGIWTLTSVDEQGKVFTGTSDVSVIEKPRECPLEYNSHNCTSKKSGSEMATMCSEARAIDGDLYWEKWSCRFWPPGQMTPVHIAAREKSKNVPMEPIWKHGSTILECSFDHSWDTITECKVEHTGGIGVFYVQEGLQHQRYSAYKSSFKNGICQFEIPEKVQDSELGIWRMHIEGISEVDERLPYMKRRRSKSLSKDCKYLVKGDANEARSRMIKRTQSPVVVKTTADSAHVQCAKDVFYPLHTCYVIKSNRLVLNDNADDLASGNCFFDLAPGEYTCGFNGPTADDLDIGQDLNVKRYYREVIDEAVNVWGNGTITLECHDIYQSALSQCLFISPSGIVYRPPSDTFHSKRFSFFRGAGSMATGDCGVEFLEEDVLLEEGQWTCVIVRATGIQLETSIKYASRPWND